MRCIVEQLKNTEAKNLTNCIITLAHLYLEQLKVKAEK